MHFNKISMIKLKLWSDFHDVNELHAFFYKQHLFRYPENHPPREIALRSGLGFGSRLGLVLGLMDIKQLPRRKIDHRLRLGVGLGLDLGLGAIFLTFSWIVVQMLLRCCLIHISTIIWRLFIFRLLDLPSSWSPSLYTAADARPPNNLATWMFILPETLHQILSNI